MKKNVLLYLSLGSIIMIFGLGIYNTYVKTGKTTDNANLASIKGELRDEKKLLELKTSGELSIIMFHATAWCSACKTMLEGDNPVYKHFMDKNDPRLSPLTYHSFQVDIDNSSLAKKYPKIMNIDEKSYKIQGVPTFVFIKNGKEVDRAVGALSMDRLIELAKKHQGS